MNKGMIHSWLLILPFILLIAAFGGTASGSWIELPPLEEPRQEVAVVELNGHIYVIGGIKKSLQTADTVEVFDPKAEKWEFSKPLPIPLHHTAAAALNGKLFAIGGRSGGIRGITSAVEVFDPGTGTWSRSASLTTARGGIGRYYINPGGSGQTGLRSHWRA